MLILQHWRWKYSIILPLCWPIREPKNQKERHHKAQNKVVSLQIGVGAVILELKLDTICITKFYGVYYSQTRNVNSKVCLKKSVIVVIHKISFTDVSEVNILL